MVDFFLVGHTHNCSTQTNHPSSPPRTLLHKIFIQWPQLQSPLEFLSYSQQMEDGNSTRCQWIEKPRKHV